MIHVMSSGGYKVFKDDKFIGAYNNLELATEVERLGRNLTSEEFDNLFGVHKNNKI